MIKCTKDTVVLHVATEISSWQYRLRNSDLIAGIIAYSHDVLCQCQAHLFQISEDN